MSEELIASSLMLNMPRLMNCGTSSATYAGPKSQVFANLDETSGSDGGAICGKFSDLLQTFYLLSAQSIKIYRKF